MTRCQWCRDPIRAVEFEPYCSVHCRAQQYAHWHGQPTTTEDWDGRSRFAVQLPLPLRWRVVCLLCGRDRWLFKPIAEMRRQRQTPCATCQGFQLVELDHGMERPGSNYDAPGVEWVA